MNAIGLFSPQSIVVPALVALSFADHDAALSYEDDAYQNVLHALSPARLAGYAWQDGQMVLADIDGVADLETRRGYARDRDFSMGRAWVKSYDDWTPRWPDALEPHPANALENGRHRNGGWY